MFPMIRKTIIPIALRRPFLSSRIVLNMPPLQFSTIADANKSQVQSYKQNIQAKIDDFPLEIVEYNPDEDLLKLKSKNPGERMEVSMVRRQINDGYFGEEESSKKTPPAILQLDVKITNNDETYMEILVEASVNEIEVLRVTLSDNYGETFIGKPSSEMAPEVRRCFMKFLAVRGINKANIEFLYEYLVKLYSFDENKIWLWPNHLKSFLKM